MDDKTIASLARFYSDSMWPISQVFMKNYVGIPNVPSNLGSFDAISVLGKQGCLTIEADYVNQESLQMLSREPDVHQIPRISLSVSSRFSPGAESGKWLSLTEALDFQFTEITDCDFKLLFRLSEHGLEPDFVMQVFTRPRHSLVIRNHHRNFFNIALEQ